MKLSSKCGTSLAFSPKYHGLGLISKCIVMTNKIFKVTATKYKEFKANRYIVWANEFDVSAEQLHRDFNVIFYE